MATSTTTIMSNSVADLKPSIHKLIRVITDSNTKIDGDCVMAVAFQQQGILIFKSLQMFDFKNDLENMISTYEINNADAGTNSGANAAIIGGIKMYI